MQFSLYVHIPFCERKCVYCDFFSVEGLESVDGFLRALRREIAFSSEFGRAGDVETIYFGGGTPSLLEPHQLETVLHELRRTFRVRQDAEVTLEANPGTASREKFAAYRRLGINRLSIGIQSFHDDELRFLSRIHTAAQAVQCVRDAQAAGFENTSLDLIYSLPGQTRGRWEENLRTALGLEPKHLSAYSLIVEDHTPLMGMVQAGEVIPNPIDHEASLFALTMAFLEERGFEHYEVSSYCRPGFRSRHNCSYWHHVNYLGFGPSAHSFWRAERGRSGMRWANCRSVPDYVNRLTRRERPCAFEEQVGQRELANERIFLGLRSDGLDLALFHEEFGIDLRDVQDATVRELATQGMASLEGNVVRLTAKGYLLGDEIAARLMIP